MTIRLATGVRRALAGIMLLIIPVHAAPQAAEAEESSLKITVREGEGALNNIRALRAKEPVVVVVDANERPVSGATVTFLLPELGPSGAFATGTSLMVTTGEDGVATGKGLKPNNVVGEFDIRVVASHQGQTARAVVHQTNAAPKASVAGGGKKTAVLLAVIGGAGAALAVGVTRGGTKTAAAANPGASISAGGTTFGPPR